MTSRALTAKTIALLGFPARGASLRPRSWVIARANGPQLDERGRFGGGTGPVSARIGGSEGRTRNNGRPAIRALTPAGHGCQARPRKGAGGLMPIAARSPFAAAPLVTATRPGPVCPSPSPPPAGASRRAPPFVLGGAEGGRGAASRCWPPSAFPARASGCRPPRSGADRCQRRGPSAIPPRSGQAAPLPSPPLPGTSIDFPDQAPPGPRPDPRSLSVSGDPGSRSADPPRPRCPPSRAGASARRSSLSPNFDAGTIKHSSQNSEWLPVR